MEAAPHLWVPFPRCVKLTAEVNRDIGGARADGGLLPGVVRETDNRQVQITMPHLRDNRGARDEAQRKGTCRHVQAPGLISRTC